METRQSLVTLKRGLAVLGAVAGAPTERGLNIRTLTRQLDLKRSTLYRYLACLEECGFVEVANKPGSFRLGSACVRLAAVVYGREFSEVARDAVRDLATTTGETVFASVCDYPHTVALLVAEGPAPVGPRVPIGSRRPLHASASGKVYLAYEPPRIVDTYLATMLQRRTSRTIVSATTLRRVLDDVRRDGYAVDQSESYEGICGIAAPVFDLTGNVAGTLNIAVAAQSLEAERINALSQRLVIGASQLSSRLGYIGGASEDGG